MQELNRLQWLPCDFSDVLNIKTFVFVFFDEIIKTLAQGLERKAHICYSLLGPQIKLFEHEPLFQVYDTVLTPALFLQVSQDHCFRLGALCVPGYCPDNLNCVNFIGRNFKALERSSKSAIAQVFQNFILIASLVFRCEDHSLSPDKMVCIFAPVNYVTLHRYFWLTAFHLWVVATAPPVQTRVRT